MFGEDVAVTTYRGVEIRYDVEKKQFVARVGQRDVRKPSQRDLEKVILKFQDGSTRKKAIILDKGWNHVIVKQIEVVGMRGSKVQYREHDRLETEDAGRVYVHDDAVLAEARKLEKEHDDWTKRWDKLREKAKQVDTESLK